VVGLCAGALVQYLHLLVGSLIKNRCSPILWNVFKALFAPWTGNGAYCNGQKIHVSPTDKVAYFLLCYIRSNDMWTLVCTFRKIFQQS
jgi:hypothetical protein